MDLSALPTEILRIVLAAATAWGADGYVLCSEPNKGNVVYSGSSVCKEWHLVMTADKITYADMIVVVRGSIDAALVGAARLGDVDVMRILLSRLPQVAGGRSTSHHTAAIFEATSRGNCDIVRLLIDAPTNTQLRAFDVQEAVVAAVMFDQVDLLSELLLEPDAPRADFADGQLLMAAVRLGCIKSAELLLKVPRSPPRADVQNGAALVEAARAARGEPIVRLLLTCPGNCVRADVRNGAALLAASRAGRETTVRLLLTCPGNCVSPNGFALNMAASCGHEGTMTVLMDAMMPDDERRVSHVWAAMLYAATRGHLSALRMLLRSVPADEVRQLELVWDTITTVAESGRAAIVRLLVNLPQGRFVSTSCAGRRYGEALTIAAEMGHVDVVRELLDAPKYAPSAAHNDGAVLVTAAARGHVDVVRVLLERGYSSEGMALRSYRARGQVTQAAHSAKLHGHESVVSLLEGWYTPSVVFTHVP